MMGAQEPAAKEGNSDWQTHSAKKQVEILHLGTLSDSPEPGGSMEIPKVIKPG